MHVILAVRLIIDKEIGKQRVGDLSEFALSMCLCFEKYCVFLIKLLKNKF